MDKFGVTHYYKCERTTDFKDWEASDSEDAKELQNGDYRKLGKQKIIENAENTNDYFDPIFENQANGGVKRRQNAENWADPFSHNDLNSIEIGENSGN